MSGEIRGAHATRVPFSATRRKLVPIHGEAAFIPDSELPSAIQRTVAHLLAQQHPDGWWAGELFVDATLCADWILYLHWSERLDPDEEQKCAAHIRRRCLPEGGWNIYHGGPPEVNASIKCYFALKLAGDSPEAPWMREARDQILRLGGIPAMNTYSKLYLALLGQFPWDFLPAVPVEIVLFPDWFFFNLHQVSAWSRAMLVPLAIIQHFQPTRPIPANRQLHELYPAGRENADFSLPWHRKLWTWRNFFLFWDRVLKWVDRLHWRPFRRTALAAAEKWMTARMGEGSGGLAAIFPAMLNSLIALQLLGHDRHSPLAKKAEADMRGLFVDEPKDFRIQPCLSPVWDTAINLIALREAGVPADHPALQKAVAWLSAREVRTFGDWTKRNPHPEASGWAFEFENRHYPDTDDTAMVLLALCRMDPSPEIIRRATGWLLSFQCRGGGWAAFDKDVTRRWLEDVPFADHNAILDPECSDLTGRVLELLGHLRFDLDDPRIQRAVEYLRRTQEDDGSWYGRWGVNYLYGTWQVLRGLRVLGWDMGETWLIRARDWLESCQNEDGGWGETCASYPDPLTKGQGPSTASQTAWALMGLCASHDPDRTRLELGLRFLLRTQNPDGTWTEPETTGTGFPGVFYLRYDSYRNNWPLIALADCLSFPGPGRRG